MILEFAFALRPIRRGQNPLREHHGPRAPKGYLAPLTTDRRCDPMRGARAFRPARHVGDRCDEARSSFFTDKRS